MLKLKGSIKISGDKSISHRALIFASLSTGKVKISNLLESDDVMRTLNILKELGVKIVKKKIFRLHVLYVMKTPHYLSFQILKLRS